MKMKYLTLLTLTSMFISSNSIASVLMINDRTDFENLGNIVYTSDFEEFSSSGFSFPSDPYTIGGVTFSNSDNLIINSGTPYTSNGTNMLVNNYWNPLKGSLEPGFDLFGFDAGWSNTDDAGSSIVITTNFGNYLFDVDFSIASSADFFGFSADNGEYITDFLITSTVSIALNAIDNVSVGNAVAQAVPEPSILALMVAGFAGLSFARRNKFKA